MSPNDGPLPTPASDEESTGVYPGMDRFPRLDWHDAFATDFSEIEWLPGRFVERGQQVALVGAGKVGKSLLVHDWLWRCATGRSFLGDKRREPLRVLYFDRENGLRDIVTRMQSLGANPDELAVNFDYRMFPRFSGGLDGSAVAASEVFGIVDESKPDVVIFDTVSRFIVGKENESDTWLQFYARIHAPLKAIGITGVRLDHPGKDLERGSRGSSAKTQDVDHVWELTITGEARRFDRASNIQAIATNLKLSRTHTRTGLGEDEFLITRIGRRRKGDMWIDGGTGHELTSNAVDPSAPVIEGSVPWLVRQLDEAGVPATFGSRKVSVECQRLGIRAAKEKIEEAVRLRKAQAEAVTNVPANVPYAPVTTLSPDTDRPDGVSAGQTSPGDIAGTYPDTPHRLTSPLPLSRERGRLAGRPGNGHQHPPSSTLDTEWPTSPQRTNCAVCGYQLDLWLVSSGETTHPNCDES